MTSAAVAIPPVWDALRGQPRVAEVLAGAAARGEVGHAWAFLGVPGVGQQEAGRALAAALNCTAGQGCGRCSACSRSLRGTHPAAQDFAPTGAQHRVADVRERWIPAANTTVVEGRWKLLHVRDADRMNDTAANAFLKVLEEPPDRTVWLLDITDPEELPETILSRCRSVRFSGWSQEALDREAVAYGLDDAVDRALVVRVAGGSPDVLRRLCAPQGLDDYRAHRSLLTQVRRHGPAVALQASAQLEDETRRRTAVVRAEGKEQAEALHEAYAGAPPRGAVKALQERAIRREREVRTAVVQSALDDLMGWCRDVVAIRHGAAPADALNLDAADDLLDDARCLAPAVPLAAVDLAAQVRDALEVNVQPTLAVEALVLSLHALYLGR